MSRREITQESIEKYWNKCKQHMGEELGKELEPFYEVFGKVGDREMAIISVSLIDNYLEQLFIVYFVKDKKVNSIFKDDHVLQSFYSKIQIAYYSGLIPQWIHNDLKLIGEIRNKFAHKCVPMLKFGNADISRKINQCVLRSPTIDTVNNPRIQFMLIIVQIVALLFYVKSSLDIFRQVHVVEKIFKKDIDPSEFALTKDEITDIIKRLKTQNKQ